MKRKRAATLSGTLLVLLSSGLLIAGASGTPTVDWWMIAGGGAPFGGGSVSVNDALGQPLIGPAVGGNVALAGGYWPGAGVASPLGVVDLAASRAGTQLQLDWTAVTRNEFGETISGVTYNVYRALDQPYFDPVTPYDSDIRAVTYTDPDPTVIGDTDHSHCYIIRAFHDGEASTVSNRVGVFAFPVIPGS